MSFRIEVKTRYVKDGEVLLEWLPLRPSHSDEPYSFATREEAEHMVWMCYPDYGKDLVRVTEVR